MESSVAYPMRYLPKSMKATDKERQIRMLNKSRRMYKSGKYYTRKKIKTYKSKRSKHVRAAEKIYKIKNITPNKELSKKTGCSLRALNEIVKKGEGAYYSSGSRPNQTPQSWGLARLASSITGGKSAAVDYKIIERGCSHKKRAFILANRSRKKYKYGQSRTPKVRI